MFIKQKTSSEKYTTKIEGIWQKLGLLSRIGKHFILKKSERRNNLLRYYQVYPFSNAKCCSLIAMAMSCFYLQNNIISVKIIFIDCLRSLTQQDGTRRRGKISVLLRLESNMLFFAAQSFSKERGIFKWFGRKKKPREKISKLVPLKICSV